MRVKDCVFKREMGTGPSHGLPVAALDQPLAEYRLYYIVDGVGSFRINGEKHVLRDDSLFITYPKDTCSIAPLGENVPYTSYSIVFEVEKSDGELRTLLEGPFMNRRALARGKNLRFLFDEMLSCFSGGDEASLCACGHYLLGLLHSLSNESQQEGGSASSLTYIDRAVEILRSKLKERVSLADVCAELNITEPHFIRIFKAHLGVPPMKYLMRLRIEEATTLLGETNLPIFQIADMLKFSSEAHFSRTFKQHRGITPMNYRIGHLHTLTARKERSEKELELANSMIQSIIDASPDLIFYKNLDSVTMWCNDAYARFVGLPKERILGRSDFEIHPRHLAEFFLERDRLIFKNNKAIKNEEWLVFPGGERRKFEVYKAPLHDPEGRPLGLLGISRDISDREEATRLLTETIESEEIANKQKSDFLFTMSEEIITSIANIREELTPAARARSEDEVARNIAFECDYLTVLAEETVAFTRFEGCEDKLDVTPFSLSALCRRLEKSLYSKYSRFNIQLRLRLDERIPELVYGDELRIYHLFIHLITASIKYSQQGFIELDGSYDRPTASITVRISEAHFSKERIESFSKMLELSEKEQSFFLKSADLSLAIASKLLKMMNGRLALKRIKNDRIEFEISIALPDSIEGPVWDRAPALLRTGTAPGS
jgi:PAS domain S-box-containing protein